MRFAKPSIELLEDRCLLSTFTVTNLMDVRYGEMRLPGSLRAAVNAVNADKGQAGVHDDIVFDPSLFATGEQTLKVLQPFKLTHGNVTIHGPGENLLCMDCSTPLTFDVKGVPQLVDPAGTNCWIIYPPVAANGASMDEAGTIPVIEDMTVMNAVTVLRAPNGSRFPGAAVFARNAVCLDRMCFDNCRAIGGASGGAVSGAQVMIEDCMFQGCTSSNYGGAIFIQGSSLDYDPTVTTYPPVAFVPEGETFLSVRGSTFTNCSAGTAGGAIYAPQLYGSLTLTNDTFAGNVAPKASAFWLDADNGSDLTGTTWAGQTYVIVA
jgi:hypothetical protein